MTSEISTPDPESFSKATWRSNESAICFHTITGLRPDSSRQVHPEDPFQNFNTPLPDPIHPIRTTHSKQPSQPTGLILSQSGLMFLGYSRKRIFISERRFPLYPLILPCCESPIRQCAFVFSMERIEIEGFFVHLQSRTKAITQR